MALALGPWTRAAAVLVTPLLLFAAVAVAANLVIEASPAPGYYETVVNLPTEVYPNGSTPPFSQTFHGVVFNLTLTDEYSPGGAWLTGTVTEPNGTAFHFSWPAWGNRTWLSPDKYCGVQPLGAVNEIPVKLLVRS